jgi:hypothetical protein
MLAVFFPQHVKYKRAPRVQRPKREWACKDGGEECGEEKEHSHNRNRHHGEAVAGWYVD